MMYCRTRYRPARARAPPARKTPSAELKFYYVISVTTCVTVISNQLQAELDLEKRVAHLIS